MEFDDERRYCYHSEVASFYLSLLSPFLFDVNQYGLKLLGVPHGHQASFLPPNYCEVGIHYIPLLLGNVQPMPYATYTSCMFCHAYFSLLLKFLGRDFIPSILVVILLFWGILILPLWIDFLVVILLWCDFVFEEFRQFEICVLLIDPQSVSPHVTCISIFP